jgi:hypothetical protein
MVRPGNTSVRRAYASATADEGTDMPEPPLGVEELIIKGKPYLTQSIGSLNYRVLGLRCLTDE